MSKKWEIIKAWQSTEGGLAEKAAAIEALFALDNAKLRKALETACEEIEYLRNWANNHGAMHDEEKFKEGLDALAETE